VNDKKISEIQAFPIDQIIVETTKPSDYKDEADLILTVWDMAFARMREWAIANAKWFQGKIDFAMDNKKKIEFFKNRKIADRSMRQNMAIKNFLIDRFEIKPEELK
jgi:hypothetical protein